MLDLKLRRLTDGTLVSVNIATLALTIQGELRVPEQHDHPLSGQARGGPGLIVRCATRQDVIECVDFASRNGLLLTMHNRTSSEWDGCNQGIAVDLSALPVAERGGSPIPRRPPIHIDASRAR